ncbi:MAG: hypothetical protein LBO79_01255 [Zoogloeaceae bacterium]|jgi:hypothetical protein|nr:hypothetical protein [Zoogloeaceae bacterium]
MKQRPALALALALWFSSVHADGSVQLSPEGAAALAKGLALQQQAVELRARANAELADETAQCPEKFLVNDCIARARTAHLESIREARRMETEGRDLEYQARLEERALKERQQADKARQKDVELPQRAVERETRHAGQAARRDKKLAEKDAKAKSGARKVAGRKAAYARKQAKQREKLEEKSAP